MKKRRIELDTMNRFPFVVACCTIAFPCPGEEIGVWELEIVSKDIRFCNVAIVTGNMQ
jgi:hypothetical protein